MNPQTLLFVIAMLACPIGMGLMMWLMNKNMGGHQDHTTPSSASPAERLKALSEQRRLLEQEIAESEKIAALEARIESADRAGVRPSGDSQPQPLEMTHG